MDKQFLNFKELAAISASDFPYDFKQDTNISLAEKTTLVAIDKQIAALVSFRKSLYGVWLAF